MKPNFGLWIIGSFFITTSLAKEIPEKTLSKFRSKRFFDNLDFASQNGWLDGRPKTNNLNFKPTPLAEVTPEKTCLRYRLAFPRDKNSGTKIPGQTSLSWDILGQNKFIFT